MRFRLWPGASKSILGTTEKRWSLLGLSAANPKYLRPETWDSEIFSFAPGLQLSEAKSPGTGSPKAASFVPLGGRERGPPQARASRSDPCPGDRSGELEVSGRRFAGLLIRDEVICYFLSIVRFCIPARATAVICTKTSLLRKRPLRGTVMMA